VNRGEALASNQAISSMSISTSNKINRNNMNDTKSKKDIDCDEDDLSSMTITAGNSSLINSISPSKDEKETVNDAFVKQQQHPPKMGSISRKELFIQVDEVKFAETVAASNNLALLDDETSPSESLVSSTESSDGIMRKTHEIASKIIEEIKEEDLEDVTPELISPGTPTHASNSLSISDGGQDFLIDDEIADQPALMISNKKDKGSPSHHDDYKSTSSNALSNTHTLREFSGSLKSLNKALKMNKNDQASPFVKRKQTIERSGSLGTFF
jgi:hypothetical protein